MNLLLLGATGNTGSQIVDLALTRGHHVTALVRSPHKIAKTHPDLTVRTGSPLAMADVVPALEGQDAVISTLGLPPTQALRPSTFMTDTVRVTVAAMRRAGVPRLAILSAAVLFPGRGLAFAFFEWLLRHHARDLVAMEAIVRESTLQFTIARPPRLVHAPDAGYRSEVDALPGSSTVASYRGVAAFLLDAVGRRLHLGETVGVTRV